jgi:hypothetical protein
MRLGAGVAAVVMAAVATLLSVGPSSAQEGDGPAEPLDVSPPSGPPGTVITVRGEGCAADLEQIVDIELVGDSAQASASVSHFDIHDGAWSARLTVPAQADPDDAFLVTADCASLGPEDDHVLVFEYEPAPFDVTTPPPTTPPAPPTTTPPAPAPAPPAAPVPAEPTFTG